MEVTSGRIENAAVEEYRTYLAEPYRPPGRGGNTSAMHSHMLVIGGEAYSFLARGSRKWVFKDDRVSFDWMLAKGMYRNVVMSSLRTCDKLGAPVVRGDRRSKARWRTAEPRMPASGREQRA